MFQKSLRRRTRKLLFIGCVVAAVGCATQPAVEQADVSEAAPVTDTTVTESATEAPALEPYEEAVAAATDPLSPKRLILVSRYGHEKVVKYLLQNNVDPDTRDHFENTPLIAASEGGHLGVVNLLIAAGADVNAANAEGKTALMAVAARGSDDIVRVLLDGGAEINVTDSGGESAIFYAVKNGQLDAVRTLLSRGADPNLRNQSRVNTSNSGYSPLMYAADHGYEGTASGDWGAITAELLSHGANPNLRNRHGTSALSIAERRFDTEIVALLNNAGARKERSYTALSESQALIKAARIGDVDKVKELLTQGAKPDTTNRAGVTPLLSAAYEGHNRVAKVLLEHGADVNLVPVGLREWAFSASGAPLSEQELMKSASWGDTALLLAIRRRHAVLVDFLLMSGADPNLPNHRGETPIFVAAAAGEAQSVKRLLEKGVDPNALETEKLTVSMTNTLPVMGRNTPLITAAQAGHKDTVDVLLEAGAEPNHQGFLNKTALFWGAERGYTGVAELLLAFEADPDLNDIEGLTPLIVAARNGNFRLAKLLIDNGAEPNKIQTADVPGEGGKAFNTTGMTALIYASRGGHNEIVGLLIDAGANVNAMSQRGETAMKEASNNGYTDIVDLLKVAGAQ